MYDDQLSMLPAIPSVAGDRLSLTLSSARLAIWLHHHSRVGLPI